MALYKEASFELDASLVTDFQQGNREAFNQLMRTHLPWIYALCRRVSDAEAEDLCQEIFLQAYQNLSSLRYPQTFVAWLRKLAWRQCQSANSKVRRLEDINEIPASTNPWNDLIDGLELGWAFDKLSTNQRQVVTLSFVYGFREKDISRMLDIPYGTVKSRLHNARKLLQKLLANAEGDMDVNIKERIIKEVDTRINEFNDRVIKPSYDDPHSIELLEENARKWHRLRQEDAENNARIYGIELADVGPRMTRERIMSGTLSRDGITHKVMGIPDDACLIDFRDVSRRLLVSPFTLLKWERQGMPTIKYFPWKRLDINIIRKWIIDNEIDPPKEVTADEVDDFVKYILREVQAGRASVDDGAELIDSL